MSSLVTVTRPHLGQVLAFTHTIQATSYNSQTYSSVSITINALVILVFLPLFQKSVVFFSSFGKLMTLEVRIMNFTPFWKRWELAHSLVLLVVLAPKLLPSQHVHEAGANVLVPDVLESV